jgi:hypothetical protein
MRLGSFLAALLVMGVPPTTILGQEIDPADPFFLAAGVNRANLIVVGTFRVGCFFLGSTAGTAVVRCTLRKSWTEAANRTRR